MKRAKKGVERRLGKVKREIKINPNLISDANLKTSPANLTDIISSANNQKVSPQVSKFSYYSTYGALFVLILFVFGYAGFATFKQTAGRATGVLTADKIDLAMYPEIFVDYGVFDAKVLVGENAYNQNSAIIKNIASSLQTLAASKNRNCKIDNCPLIANPGQEDDDGDGIGDLCDDKDDSKIEEVKPKCTDDDEDGYSVEPGCSIELDCDDNDAAVYPKAPEVCNNRDDNCNSQVDEGIDLLNDVRNCGRCSNPCSVYANALSTCANGQCALGSCNAGYFNCDNNAANGCESATSCKTCTDSDGGKNYAALGLTSSNSGVFDDTCAEDKILTEYFCKQDGTISSERYDCTDESKLCSQGKCVEPTGTVTCSEVDGSDYTVGEETYLNVNGISYDYLDKCTNNDELIEMSCDGNKINKVKHSCAAEGKTCLAYGTNFLGECVGAKKADGQSCRHNEDCISNTCVKEIYKTSDPGVCKPNLNNDVCVNNDPGGSEQKGSQFSKAKILPYQRTRFWEMYVEGVDKCIDNRYLGYYICAVRGQEGLLTSTLQYCNSGCLNGACLPACPTVPNGAAIRKDVIGECYVSGCVTGYYDCDGILDNGCESATACTNVLAPAAVFNGNRITGAVAAGKSSNDPDEDGIPSECSPNVDIITTPDNDLLNLNDLIVIGSPCENSVALELLDTPEPCDKGMELGVGYIRVFNINNHLQVLVTGKNEKEVKIAANALAEKKLTGTNVKVTVDNAGNYKIVDADKVKESEEKDAIVELPVELPTIEPEPVEIPEPAPSTSLGLSSGNKIVLPPNTGFNFATGEITQSLSDADFFYNGTTFGTGAPNNPGANAFIIRLESDEAKLMSLGPNIDLSMFYQAPNQDFMPKQVSFPIYAINDGIVVYTANKNYGVIKVTAITDKSMTFDYNYNNQPDNTTVGINPISINPNTECQIKTNKESCYTNPKCSWDEFALICINIKLDVPEVPKVEQVKTSLGKFDSSPVSDSFLVSSPDSFLTLNKKLNEVKTEIGKNDFGALNSYSITNEKGTVSAEQKVKLGDGVVVFEKNTDTDVVTDYLTFKNENKLLDYELKFEPAFKSDVVTKSANSVEQYLEDIEGSSIQIGKRDYKILTAKKVKEMGLRLTLVGGDISDSLAEGKNKTYTVNGKEYEVANVIVTDYAEIIKAGKANFVVNDKEIKALDKGEEATLDDGMILSVKNTEWSEPDDVIGSLAEFCLKSATTANCELSDMIEVNKPKSYNVKGKDYTINVKNVEEIHTGQYPTVYTQLKVNGDLTKNLQAGQTDRLRDGTILGIKSIASNNAGSEEPDIVEFTLGSNKVELSDNDITNNLPDFSVVKINNEPISDAQLIINGSVEIENNVLGINKISVSLKSDDNYWIEAGKRLSEVVDTEPRLFLNAFGFDYLYAGIDFDETESAYLEPNAGGGYQLRYYDSNRQNMVIMPLDELVGASVPELTKYGHKINIITEDNEKFLLIDDFKIKLKSTTNGLVPESLVPARLSPTHYDANKAEGMSVNGVFARQVSLSAQPIRFEFALSSNIPPQVFVYVTAAKKEEVPECTDTDGEDWKIFLYEKGSVTANNKEYSDYCSGSLLMEYGCKDNKPYVEDWQCGEGTICKDGACSSNIVDETATECKDSDGEDWKIFLYEKGSVTANNKEYSDYCSGSLLMEYGCKDNKPYVEDWQCGEGTICKDGACKDNTVKIDVEPPIKECTDTDSTYAISLEDGATYNPPGEDRYTLGSVTFEGKTSYDYCEKLVEYTDDFGNIQTKFVKDEKGERVIEQACIDGKKHYEATATPCKCENGACIKEKEKKCTDSEGIVYYAEKKQDGVTEVAKWKDECNKDSNLIDYSCENDKFASKITECPYGCKDGACVKDKNECTDTDGGKDIFTKGSADNKVDFCFSKETDGSEDRRGVCKGENCYIDEYYCDERGVQSAELKCAGDCQFGRCLKDGEELKCLETDSGKDYFVQGMISGTADGMEHPDFCILNPEILSNGLVISDRGKEVSSCNGKECYLIERFCPIDYWKNTKQYLHEGYSCPNGCKDGACIKEEPVSKCGNSICEKGEDSASCNYDCKETVIYVDTDKNIYTKNNKVKFSVIVNGYEDETSKIKIETLDVAKPDGDTVSIKLIEEESQSMCYKYNDLGDTNEMEQNYCYKQYTTGEYHNFDVPGEYKLSLGGLETPTGIVATYSTFSVLDIDTGKYLIKEDIGDINFESDQVEKENIGQFIIGKYDDDINKKQYKVGIVEDYDNEEFEKQIQYNNDMQLLQTKKVDGNNVYYSDFFGTQSYFWTNETFLVILTISPKFEWSLPEYSPGDSVYDNDMTVAVTADLNDKNDKGTSKQKEDKKESAKSDKYDALLLAYLKKYPSTLEIGKKTFTLNLVEGMNLVSVPLVADDVKLESIFKNNLEEIEAVYSYDNVLAAEIEKKKEESKIIPWKVWHSDKKIPSDLEKIEPGKAYWIKAKTQFSVTIKGQLGIGEAQIPVTTKVTKGWNLVGIHSTTKQTIDDAFVNIKGKYNSLWTYKNNALDKIEIKSQEEEMPNYLTPGKGYWIYATEEGEIVS